MKLLYLADSHFKLLLIFFIEVLLGFIFFSYRNSKMVQLKAGKNKFYFLFFDSVFAGIFFNAFVVLFSSIFPFFWTERVETVYPSLLNFDVSGVDVIPIAALVISPVVEELIFRKFLLNVAVKGKLPFASIFVSVIFVFSHPVDFFKYFSAMILLFLLSEQLNYLYLRTGRLIFPIGMHVAFDLSRKFMRGVFYNDQVSSLLKNTLMVFEILIFVVLLLFLNFYLKGQKEKNASEKSDNKFNFFCYGAFAIFIFINVFVL